MRRKVFRAIIVWLLATGAVFGLIGLVFVLVMPSDYSDTAKGSPEYAARWRTILEQFPDPESAQAAYPEIMVKRFPNGEWAFGVDRDSHEFKDGGTIVIKDSTGRIRAFFGHVCGSGRLGGFMRESNSLDELYKSKQWQVFAFSEYEYP